MEKTVKTIDRVTCYFHFMFNAWNEEQARKVFATANCGWQYLWQKWCDLCERDGMYAAVTIFYTESLDNKHREMLANAANEYYNG